AGGLAGGLAAGAGIVAGEALAHRLLDGGHSRTPPTPATDDGGPTAANTDMGGADFGLNDPGSWDDRSGGWPPKRPNLSGLVRVGSRVTPPIQGHRTSSIRQVQCPSLRGDGQASTRVAAT